MSGDWVEIGGDRGKIEGSSRESRSTELSPCNPACAADGVAALIITRRRERRCSVGWPLTPAHSSCSHSAETSALPSPISRAVVPLECLKRAEKAACAAKGQWRHMSGRWQDGGGGLMVVAA